MGKILITGATGELGGLTIDHLIENKKVPKNQIVALARRHNEKLSSKGVEVRIGDYEDIESLETAFKGIDKLFLISTQELYTPLRMKQLINAVLSAKKNEVKHIVFVSFSKPEKKLFEIEDVDIAIEHMIYALEIPYTIMRNPVYFDELRHDLKIAKEAGVLLSATKGKSFNYSLKSDLALANATVLTEEGHINKLYDLSHNELMTYQELAEILSDITQKKIDYQEKSEEEVIANMINHNISKEAADLLVGYFHRLISENEFNYTSNDLVKLLGNSISSKKEAVLSLLSLDKNNP